MTPAFLEYSDLQLSRHHLMMCDTEESVMYELEDRMTKLWDGFDDVQRKDLRGMAADLNWVRRGGKFPIAIECGQTIQLTSENRRWMAEERSKGEWLEILDSMRVHGPIFSTFDLAFYRGEAYQAIGLPGYATIFYDFAVKSTDELTDSDKKVIQDVGNWYFVEGHNE